MTEKDGMRYLLDGNDWIANYFLSEEEYRAQKQPFTLENKLMDSARSIRFHGASRPDAFPASVPGCDRTVLLENGEIEDPYYGRNMEKSRWSEKASWVFRKDFVLPDEMKEMAHIDLTFFSISYRVNGFLNDGYLGMHGNQFDPWIIDVSDMVKWDGSKNTLTLIFDPAPAAECNHHHDRPADFALYHACQMSHGWDWSRHLVPVGIFDHVELHGVKDARIADCHFRTRGNHVFLDAEICALTDHAATLAVELAPADPCLVMGQVHAFGKRLNLTAGTVNRFSMEFDVPEAKKWFPNGYGEQPLYRLSLRIDGDTLEKQVSFRDLRMIRNPGSPEQAYPLTFEINGKAVFARGLNWVPADLMFSRINENTYDREVRLAKEAGFNLFRVWGGGLIEKEEFYEACDRYGMLVWQEFPHACSRYPTDALYLNECARIGRAAVSRLRNHPSTALFCGGNEVLYYGEDPMSPIYRQYESVIREMAPEYPYHSASPDLSRPGERDHGPWCFEEHKFWNTHFRWLASELGCEGTASEESLEKFIPPEETPLAGQSWKYHFTYDTDSRPVKRWMENFAADPADLYEISQASMFTQGEQLGYVMEHYRNLFPKNSGCFIWQFNESWPTNAFSILDYYTVPKTAYYRLAKANAPAILFLEDDSLQIRDGVFRGTLYAVSDSALPEKALCTAELMTLEGTVLEERSFEEILPAGSLRLCVWEKTLPADLPGGVLLLRLRIRSGARELWRNERLYGVPDFRQVLHLPEGKAEVTFRTELCLKREKKLFCTVRNTGTQALLNLRASAEGCSGEKVFWKENDGVVFPGESRTWEAVIGPDAPEITGIRLKGWNFNRR